MPNKLGSNIQIAFGEDAVDQCPWMRSGGHDGEDGDWIDDGSADPHTCQSDLESPRQRVC